MAVRTGIFCGKFFASFQLERGGKLVDDPVLRDDQQLVSAEHLCVSSRNNQLVAAEDGCDDRILRDVKLKQTFSVQFLALGDEQLA